MCKSTNFCLVLVALVGLVLLPNHQVRANPMLDADVPVDNCSSIRLKGGCKPAPLSAEDNQRKVTMPTQQVRVRKRLELPPQQPPERENACDAHFSISYLQKNRSLSVDSLVKNASCAASHGEYELRVRTRDEAGESHTATLTEQWSRGDTEDVAQNHLYPLAAGADLVWVRVRSNRTTACTCD